MEAWLTGKQVPEAGPGGRLVALTGPHQTV
jgi:hypothetical protein